MNEDTLGSNFLDDEYGLLPDAAELLKELDDDDEDVTVVTERPAINTLSVAKALTGSPTLTPTCELITYAGPRASSAGVHSAFAASQMNPAVPLGLGLGTIRSSKTGIAPAPSMRPASQEKLTSVPDFSSPSSNQDAPEAEELKKDATIPEVAEPDSVRTEVTEVVSDGKKSVDSVASDTTENAEKADEACVNTSKDSEKDTEETTKAEESKKTSDFEDAPASEENKEKLESAKGSSDSDRSEAEGESSKGEDVAKIGVANPATTKLAMGRPSIPPPMPAGGFVQPVGRIIKENEVVVTKDYLAEIVAGGRLDEAKDLEKHDFQDNAWYAQVFNNDYFRTLPKNMERQTKREVKFILDQLGLESDATILDLCCGHGRHTLELARHGMNMIGMDLSMDMLRYALEAAKHHKLSVKLIHGDMQKLNFKSIFDGIFNVQTSFGYFNDQKNFKVLQGIFRALKPGGRFLIETVNRDFMIDELPMRLWWKAKECTLLEEIDMDSLKGVLKVKRSFVFDEPGRQPWEQNINIRLYSAAELRGMLVRAGFDVLELSGDYSLPGAFFGATSPKIILLAERPC